MYTKEGIKGFYLSYVEDCKKFNKEPQPYKIYTSILKEGNKLIRDKVIFESETVDLPYRLGKLSIIKFDNNFDIEKKYKWKIDFKKTKELGQVVYYGSPFGYRWKWNKSRAIVKGKMYYRFIAARDASRMIAVAIKNNVDYYKDDSRFYQK